MADEDIKNLEDEIRRLRAEKDKKKPSIISNIPPQRRMWGLIACAGVIWYGWTHQWSLRIIGVTVAGIMFVIYVMSVGTEPNVKRVLTREECRIRLMEQIKRERMRPIGDIPLIKPNEKVLIGWPGKLIYRQGKPLMRTSKLIIYDPRTHNEIVWQINQEAFEGDIIGIIERPEGMTGEEQRDVELVASPELAAEKRYYKYSGKKWPK